jgi:hypothetical protein
MTKPILAENEDTPQQDSAGEKGKYPDKNRGGRPKGSPHYGNCKVNIYLSDEEYKLFMEFVTEGWYDKNSSGAGRHLLSRALHDWVKKGRKKM